MVKFWIIDAGLYPPRWGKDQWPFSEKHQRRYRSKCPESFQQENIQTDDGLRQVYVSQMSQVMENQMKSRRRNVFVITFVVSLVH